MIIEPTLQQEAEGIRPRAIWWVGIGILAVGAGLVLIAWWLVAGPTAIVTAAQPSSLKRDLIERATGGADLHTAGAQALERTQWVDRKAGTVRIPIERAIDAVVADPSLLRAHAAPAPIANPAAPPPPTSASSSVAKPAATPAPTNAASAGANSSTGAGRGSARDADAAATPREVAQ
ncbi:MAG TPA: hypothetical protein VLM79_17255 [Kofleriaceae bacterium]|nr:hypothetical protein [Kofleriaceae bacterium]